MTNNHNDPSGKHLDNPGGSRSAVKGLNDLLRTTFTAGRIVMTNGIMSLPDQARGEVLAKVRGFDAFDEACDPHGEHDFGAFDQSGVGKIFWKIDYYDPTLTRHSDDPADPGRTCRVLTIMLAEEY